MTTLSIMVVANSQETCAALSTMLNPEQTYEILSFDDVITGVNAVSEHSPQLLLVDNDEADLTSEMLCQAMIDNNLSDQPTILLSTSSSQEDEINYYTAGVDDYLRKPINPHELQQKVKARLSAQHQIAELMLANQNYMQVAMTTMANSSEMGIIMRFMRGSFHCTEHEELAALIFDAIDSFSLECTIMMMEMGDPVFYFFHDIERPVEKKVLLSLHDKIRIFDFQGRIIFNTPHISLLVRQLPDDAEKIGRLKDHIAILVDGVDARIAGIDSELELQNKQDILSNIVGMATKSIENIHIEYKKRRDKNSDLMSELAAKLEEAFLYLGLDEKQESFLTQLIQDTENTTDELFTDSTTLDQELHLIIDRVNRVLNESKKTKFGHKS